MDLKLTYGSSANLSSIPIEDGAIRAVKDTKELYIDIDGERTNFSGVKEKIAISEIKPTDEDTNIWFEVEDSSISPYKINVLSYHVFGKKYGVPFYLSLNDLAIEEEMSILTLDSDVDIKSLGTILIKPDITAYVYTFFLKNIENDNVTKTIKLKINNKEISENNSDTVTFITDVNYNDINYIYKDMSDTLSSNYEYKYIDEGNNIIGFDIYDSSNETTFSSPADIKIYINGEWEFAKSSNAFSDSWNGNIYSIRVFLNFINTSLTENLSSGNFLLSLTWYPNASAMGMDGYTIYLIYNKEANSCIEIENLKDK